MKLAKMTHSTGVNELYLDYDEDYMEFILCATGRDKDGKNISQIDLYAYSKKQMKRLIKNMKKYIKEQE